MFFSRKRPIALSVAWSGLYLSCGGEKNGGRLSVDRLVEVGATILGSLDCCEKRITRKSGMNRRQSRLAYE